jgi:hypothetical protein
MLDLAAAVRLLLYLSTDHGSVLIYRKIVDRNLPRHR